MVSPMISTPVITTSVRTPKRKKNKKKQQVLQAQNGSGASAAQWKSSAQQHAYSSKLLEDLCRHVSITRSPHRRAVREAADRSLAVAAKGKTRWSRAILQKSRLKVKFTKVNRATRVLAHSSSRTKKPSIRLGILRLKSKNKAAEVQRKAKVLGRLVPGCRKEAFPVVLEEAADYISALQMQVRAMTALTHLLSASTTTTSAAQHTPS